MACETDPGRPQIELAGVEIDKALAAALLRYAVHHEVTISDVVEGALVNFMHEGSIPVQPQWCAKHRCAMIFSDGGAVACPEGEVEPGMVFIPDNIYPEHKIGKR